MNKKMYIDFLLTRIPSAKLVSGGKLINCRCMECPDSSNFSSRHFYISIPQSNEEPSLYYCHLCKCSGVVTEKTLLFWGIYDNQVASELLIHNKELLKDNRNRKYKDREIYNINNSFITDCELSNIKLQYINNRLGTSLSFNDILNLKIILNLKDLLYSNNITSYTRNDNIINQLNNNFVGFITMDNAFINMRNIYNSSNLYHSINKRYINYSIYDKCDNSQKFYTLPITYNLDNTKRLRINIAEGPFDILSVYLNICKDSTQVYTAITGSRFKSVIREFICILKLLYIELHIYLDNDKYGSMYVVDDIKNFIYPFNIPLYIHKNLYENEKDFGVPCSKINEYIERIL